MAWKTYIYSIKFSMDGSRDARTLTYAKTHSSVTSCYSKLTWCLIVDGVTSMSIDTGREGHQSKR